MSPASSISVERYTRLRLWDAVPGAYGALTICAHIPNGNLAPKELQRSLEATNTKLIRPGKRYPANTCTWSRHVLGWCGRRWLRFHVGVTRLISCRSPHGPWLGPLTCSKRPFYSSGPNPELDSHLQKSAHHTTLAPSYERRARSALHIPCLSFLKLYWHIATPE